MNWKKNILKIIVKHQRSNRRKFMKKIINKDSNVIEEMLLGYLKAYNRYYERISDYNAFLIRGY
jgi:hypothetical protein